MNIIVDTSLTKSFPSNSKGLKTSKEAANRNYTNYNTKRNQPKETTVYHEQQH
jgi:hypothetical protein